MLYEVITGNVNIGQDRQVVGLYALGQAGRGPFLVQSRDAPVKRFHDLVRIHSLGRGATRHIVNRYARYCPDNEDRDPRAIEESPVPSQEGFPLSRVPQFRIVQFLPSRERDRYGRLGPRRINLGRKGRPVFEESNQGVVGFSPTLEVQRRIQNFYSYNFV